MTARPTSLRAIHLAVACALAFAGGCASTAAERAPAASDDDARALVAAEAELQRQEAELDPLLAQSLAVDCTRALLIRDNICGLATQICLLARKTPADRR